LGDRQRSTAARNEALSHERMIGLKPKHGGLILRGGFAVKRIASRVKGTAMASKKLNAAYK
jgi:hypothetical protein